MPGSTTPGFDAVEVENIPRLTGGKPFFTSEPPDVFSIGKPLRNERISTDVFAIRRPFVARETQIDWAHNLDSDAAKFYFKSTKDGGCFHVDMRKF